MWKILLAAGLILFAPAAAIAKFPERPIKIVVGYPPGGGTDIAARIVAEALTKRLGQSVIVDNRPGATGIIGASLVAAAKPDGYTVLFDASAFVTNQVLRDLPFNPSDSFTPVSLVVVLPMVLVAAPGAPFKTLKEFIDYAARNPNAVTYGSSGIGSSPHIAAETLNQLAHLDIRQVPYQGGPPAITATMAGQISVYFGIAASTINHIKSGSLRALAVGSASRLETLPDVPTLIESGFGGVVVQEWNGIFLPKGTPAEIVSSLSDALAACLSDPDVKARLEAAGLQPVGNKPDQFQSFVANEIERTRAVVVSRNIKAN